MGSHHACHSLVHVRAAVPIPGWNVRSENKGPTDAHTSLLPWSHCRNNRALFQLPAQPASLEALCLTCVPTGVTHNASVLWRQGLCCLVLCSQRIDIFIVAK